MIKTSRVKTQNLNRPSRRKKIQINTESLRTSTQSLFQRPTMLNSSKYLIKKTGIIKFSFQVPNKVQKHNSQMI